MATSISPSVPNALDDPLTPYSFDTEYVFPRHFLPTVMKDETKIPLVLVACGSFSPITYLHLRMFEMAKDHFTERNEYELLTGYYSPVSDAYMKEGLAEAKHRVKMCQLAVESTSNWLMVDPWEPSQTTYQRTAVVLDHFEHELNVLGGGILTKTGARKRIRIMLLAGGDLIASFGHPGVWAPNDLHHIVGYYGSVIIERTGTDVYGFLLSHDILYQHRMNVTVIKQLIHNDISSTKIRLFVKRGMSIKYLLPNPVIDYILHHHLYVPKQLEQELPSTLQPAPVSASSSSS
ncbi:putative nicotinamide mononucleotide adenylyltransferase [Halteromyces radiatus]|uniref:putative nicotinamide mononucleotide adenylyltransferase n=1 Tax=Halteromyces radiatus TaxID=101107 RepID=UPI0022209A50|nr:putative nicotinamide mononucleotide adenylyltransferase [Halteromyces radiatus]KAI8084708.1 putative nicotinamide mononucleotide adenylyltransferase [Halteromyces radiatus]